MCKGKYRVCGGDWKGRLQVGQRDRAVVGTEVESGTDCARP